MVAGRVGFMPAVNAMKAARREFGPWLWTLLLAVSACSDASNYSGVYVELAEGNLLDGDRTHAYRVTVFEYSNRVGGFVEFFEIDGVRNTPTNPYFEETACVYFGDGGIANGEFAVDTSAFDAPFLARAFLSDRRRRLELDVLDGAQTWAVEPGIVQLERSSTSSGRSCDDR